MFGIKRRIIQLKRKWYTYEVKKSAAKVGDGLRVNNKSYVSKTTILGNNVNFNGMEILDGGRVIIGDNFHSGRGCLILSQDHNYDEGKSIPYDDTYIKKDVIIEDNVWLGERVIVLGGTHIGEGAIIQAGSVVVGNIPKYAIAGGHPAKVFKTRNVDHYITLKAKGMFS